MLSRPDTFEADVVAAMPSVRRFAYALTGTADRADDLTQDVVLRAIEARHSFTPGTNLEAWLFVIARNSFRSQFRKRKREVEDPDDQMARAIPLEDSPLRKMEVAEVLRLVDKMPAQFRDVLRRLADGATYDEVAFELREQIGTIKSRAHRGREILKAASPEGGA